MPARKFDWNSAWQMFTRGATIAAIAQKHGVSDRAVRRALFPGLRVRLDQQVIDARRRREMTGECVDCGTAVYASSKRCRSCNYRFQALAQRAARWQAKR